ncbi:MAG: ABC transporter permease [Proteobacteria bacterium]|nr:ABC transporter permease [Pseudomonadota bacterium]
MLTPRIRSKVISLGARSLILGIVCVFLFAPIMIVVASSFDYGPRAYVIFPPERFTLDAYINIPEHQIDALILSIGVGVTAAIGASLIGIPAALGIVRSNVLGKSLIMTLFRIPLQIPGVVTGLAFLQAYYAVGAATGWYANGSFIGLAIAHIFAATPFVIGALVPMLQRFEPVLEEAAQALGATRMSTFRKITLPLMAPGIFAGCLYAFMVSFGDVPIAIFLSKPGTSTFPVEVFLALEQEFEPTLLASSTLVIIFSLIVMLLIQRFTGLDLFVRSR